MKKFSLLLSLFFIITIAYANPHAFQLEEANIDSVHNAIQSGSLQCETLIASYLDRIEKYNSALIAATVSSLKYVMPAKAGIQFSRLVKTPGCQPSLA